MWKALVDPTLLHTRNKHKSAKIYLNSSDRLRWQVQMCTVMHGLDDDQSSELCELVMDGSME
uniref:Uncharacterized protein n=1 Tax=Arundo donax TaxID=35708 RepID=A0A0A9DD11_ARUDO